MSQRKEEFIIGEIYHITVRGVDGRPIFMDGEDDWRMVFSLYEFNTTELVIIRKQREKRLKYKEMIRSGLATAELERRMKEDNRDKLVEILAFVFMPNHVHLLLRQIKPGGISLFMQKLGSGYPRYFNSRYERKGHLFQDKFASSHISGNDYLKTVFVYIHTNPISLVEPRWKEKGVENPENAITFLEGYRWSSYLDYLGKNNFPALTERSFLNGVFRDQKTIKEFVDSWIRCKSITCINNRFKQG